MATTRKILADGQLPNTKTTLYTVPGSTAAGIAIARLVNTDSSARTANFYVKKSGGTSRRIIPKDYSLAVGALLSVLEPGEVIPLQAGDIIEGDASAATVVDYTIYGAEYTP